MAHKETSNTWLIGALWISLIVGCATTPKQDYGPAGEPALPAGENVGPTPETKRAVVVVMAGTGARAFASVGVLKELVARKIEIGGLVGTGLGGTIAVLFAKAKSINEFEWMMTRLRDSMLDGSPDGREALREYLHKTLGEADLAELRRNVVLLVHSTQRGEARVVERGRAHIWAAASALAEDSIPELKVDGERVYREMARPYPISVARQLSRGLVVAVDVRPEALDGAEIQEASIVFRPDLAGLSDQDFSRRSSMIFRGSKTVREQGDLLERKLRE